MVRPPDFRLPDLQAADADGPARLRTRRDESSDPPGFRATDFRPAFEAHRPAAGRLAPLAGLERRHFHRVLHPQSDIPQTSTKASYRALVTSLRHGQAPESGVADEQESARLAGSWGELRDRQHRARLDAGVAGSGRSPSAWRRYAPPEEASATLAGAAMHCAWCSLALEGSPTRCTACGAPARTMPRLEHRREGLGRRAAPRHDRTQAVLMWMPGDQPFWAGRWVNVSEAGFSVLSTRGVATGRRLQLRDTQLALVGQVLRCRAEGPLFALHGRLLRWAPVATSP